jgi:hypothetical protein
VAHNAQRANGNAIRRSEYRGGAGGRHKAALARLHSARSLNRSQGFTAGCRGSSLAPTGLHSFQERARKKTVTTWSVAVAGASPSASSLELA